MKLFGLALILAGIAGTMFGITAVPEIDGSSSVSAVTLIAGSLLILRSRRKK